MEYTHSAVSLKLHSFTCQIRQNQSVSFKAEAAMLDSQVVQNKYISLPPRKSNSVSPTGSSDVLNHFRFYFTSVTIKRVGWVHVIRQRDTFKHRWFLVVCVVMYVRLREPYFAACDWVSCQRWKRVPVSQISSAFLPFVTEIFPLQVFFHCLQSRNSTYQKNNNLNNTLQ